VSKINIFFEDIDNFSVPKKLLKNKIVEIINAEKNEAGEINIIFCSDEYLLEINKKYLNHDYYTDIVTFNYVEENVISGDLYISNERVKENALKFEVDFINELYRVVFHGILHLCGYDDGTEVDKKVIRKKENYYLNKI
jgi:probable rRNA maturation factor